ncbi:MAG: AbrB family transcriptional regulator, partial [bacterium]
MPLSFLSLLGNTAILFLLGSIGWALFWFLHSPVPGLLGSLFLLGTLRAWGVDLPPPPAVLSVLVSSMLGMTVGARITRENVKELRKMFLPALVIISWALLIVFVFGYFLARTTDLDIPTAILSSCMGGVAEMTLIALDTDANVPVVVIMQTLRVFVTIMTFPLVLSYMVHKKEGEMAPSVLAVTAAGEGKEDRSFFRKKVVEPLENIYRKLTRLDWGFPRRLPARLAAQRRWFLSYAIAVCGGLSFSRLGVPAGAMVGSLFITAVISLLGFFVPPTAPAVYNFMLIGLGIVITSNITSETIKSLTPKLLLPILFTLVVIYLTSLLVSFIIYKITGWDYP